MNRLDEQSEGLIRNLAASVRLRIRVHASGQGLCFDTDPGAACDAQPLATCAIRQGHRRLGRLTIRAAGSSRDSSAAAHRLAPHLATTVARAWIARQKHGHRARLQARREREWHYLRERQLLMPAGSSPRDAIALALETFSTIDPAICTIISLMSRDLTFVSGSLPGLGAESDLLRALPLDHLGLVVLTRLGELETPCVRLAREELPELAQVVSEPLEVWALPVRVGGHAIGYAAVLRSEDPHAAEPITLPLLASLTHQLGAILASVHLGSEMHGFLFETVKSLVAAVDAKDPYTRGHSERVHYLAVRIGESFGLAPRELMDLSWAALLHDIGKLGIPGRILRKPTRLSAAEWEVIKTHPERGCQVIAPIPQLAGALPGIRHHHERMDGMGYPAGLTGTEIPLLARIVATADSYDALTSNRTYEQGHACAPALVLLEKVSGPQLDPEIVACARRVIEREIASGSMAFETQRRTRRAA